MTLLVVTAQLLQEKINEPHIRLQTGVMLVLHSQDLISQGSRTSLVSAAQDTQEQEHKPPSVSIEDLCLWCWSRACLRVRVQPARCCPNNRGDQIRSLQPGLLVGPESWSRNKCDPVLSVCCDGAV